MINQYFLPTEILTTIAYHLFLENKDAQHLCICKHWYSCFLLLFYRNVNILTQDQWKRFNKTLHENRKQYISYYVHHLYINDNVSLLERDILSLPCLFPYLETLYFNPDLWRSCKKKPNLNLNAWKKLTILPPLSEIQASLSFLELYGHTLQELSLCASLFYDLTDNKHSIVYRLCGMTPRVKRLTLDGGQQTTLSLHNILLIHNLLSSLESLELHNCTLSTPSQTSIIPPPFPQMARFSLNNCDLSHYKWMYYLCDLYPHLTELNLNAQFIPTYRRTIGRCDRNNAQEGFERLATTLNRLKKVNLGKTIHLLSEDNRPRFFEMLSKHINTGLESIIEKGSPSPGIALFSALITCARPTTTKSLNIQLWRSLGGIHKIMPTIERNTSLVELKLNCGKFSYSWKYGCDINTIFKHCRQLESLDLTMARLTVLGDEYTVAPKMKTVRLRETHFTTDSMDMLASCCPQLEHLELVQCVKDRDSLNQKVHFCLPNHCLKTLIIDQLYLRPSQYVKQSRLDIALFALRSTDHYQWKLKKSPNKEAHEADWYHVHSLSSKRCIRRLAFDEHERVENYAMSENDWSLLENDDIVRGTYRESKHWEQDVPYGYVYIDCKSIKRLYFNKIKL